jgi:hypothetical protein
MQTFTRIFGQAYSTLLCEIHPHVAYLAIRHEMLPSHGNALIAAGTRAAREPLAIIIGLPPAPRPQLPGRARVLVPGPHVGGRLPA